MPARQPRPTRSQDPEYLAELGGVLLAMTDTQRREFLAGLDRDNLEVAERALAARIAVSWRATPVTMGVHFGALKPWRYSLLLGEKFADAVEGRSIRQIWNLGPQFGKSAVASQWGPAWALDRYPERRFVLTSYGGDLANRNSYAVRNILREHRDDLRVRLRADQQRQDRFTTPQGGGILAAGIDAGITGWGAHGVVCFVAGTSIETPSGPTSIETVARNGGKVWAYDHAAGRVVEAAVTASRVNRVTELVEVEFASGRKFTCTPEHPVYVTARNGYVAAGELRPATKVGTLQTVRGALRPQGQVLRRMQRDPRLDVEPNQAQARTMGRDDVPSLRHGVPSDGGGLRQVATSWREDLLLRTEVRRGRVQPSCGGPDLQTLRRFDGVDQRTPLLPAVPGSNQEGTTEEDAGGQGLSPVRQGVRAEKQSASVLLQDVRQPGPLATHEGQGQLSFPQRRFLRRALLQAAPVDPGTGRWGLHRLSGNQWPDRRPPLRRAPGEQPAREPRHAVHFVPCEASQIGTDTVSMVRRIRVEGVEVYDLTVEGASNFFAEGVLVHNCDDPFKNWVDAHSAASRQLVWNQYRSVLRMRLTEEWAFVIVVQTRWHEDDLTGRLVDAWQDGTGEEFEVVRLPEIAEAPDLTATNPILRLPDPLGRAPGDLLEPERFSAEATAGRKLAAGTYLWAGLHQQRPAPEEGTEIQRAWFRLDEVMPERFDAALTAWDVKLKDKEAGDFVVGQCWLRTGSDFWLIDQLRGQWNQATTTNAIALLAVRHPDVRQHVIENTGNGPEVMESLRRALPDYVLDPEMAGQLGMTEDERLAVQALRRRGLPGLLPYNPKGSKSVRMRAHAPLLEAGNVHLNARASWLGAYLDEAAAFPNGAFDDVIDATSCALSRLSHGTASVASPASAPLPTGGPSVRTGARFGVIPGARVR